MSRIKWQAGQLTTGIMVQRGLVGDVPMFVVRPATNGRSILTDRLQQTVQVHDTADGAKKDAENRLAEFMERIGAQFKEAETVVLGTTTGRVPRSLTETRRKVLQNVADGNELYHGMAGTERETAIRFVARWRELPSLIRHAGIGSPLELTDAGRKALETGEY